MNSISIGVVGASGAVGLEIIRCLRDIAVPSENLRLFASAMSAGKIISVDDYDSFRLEEYCVHEARNCALVFLAVSGTFSEVNAPLLTKNNGPIVIDNSSAFRYLSHIPLVVPEINFSVIRESNTLIANPNCTTAIAAMVLWPIHQCYHIKKIIMSTYQAASGAGAEGMQELLQGTSDYLNGRMVDHRVFAHPLPFNVIPHIDSFQSNGYTREEMKVVWEINKIFGLNDGDIQISVTAVRVPTLRAHAEAITLETEKPIDVSELRSVLSVAPGVLVVDDPSHLQYPMPLTASHSTAVEVGRIRQSLIFGEYGVDLFVCGDQLLRGAAWNAVKIAQMMFEK